MYQVDERDRVVVLPDLPQSSIGAPVPLVLADEFRAVIAYYLEEVPAGWDGTSTRVIDSTTADEPIGVVCLDQCTAHMFGPPNDEAFSGHPLASRGLRPYSAFEVTDSSWVRILERMNSVHPWHRAESFWVQRHLVFTFHDSTFECVCRSFSYRHARGSIQSVIPLMLKLLKNRSDV
jgi:hypothetical protein